MMHQRQSVELLARLGAVLLIPACSPAEREPTSGLNLEEEVTSFLNAYLAAMQERDSTTIRAAYVDDGRFVWIEDGEVRYRTGEEVLRSLGTFPAGASIRTDLKDLTIIPVGGEGAHAWASFTTSVGSGPGSFSFGGIISFVLESDGTSWKLIGGHTSSPRPN